MRQFVIQTGCLLLVLCLSACHTRKRELNVDDRSIESLTVSDKINISNDREMLLDIAIKWKGVPYKYGGNSKDGTDCSGMVLQVYLEALGLKLPRNSAKQAEFCKKLSAKDVLPGDLVFFATGKDASSISHVGIMLDADNFIHSSTSKGVCISKLSLPYYQRTFKMFGRVPDMK